jgi:hypothetical protein
MIEHLLDAIQVKIVTYVLFVDFTEELVVLQVAEPTDPAHALLRAVALGFGHIVEIWIDDAIGLYLYFLIICLGWDDGMKWLWLWFDIYMILIWDFYHFNLIFVFIDMFISFG